MSPVGLEANSYKKKSSPKISIYTGHENATSANVTVSQLFRDILCTVLPPSQNSCPTSSLNRENSGIAPKRHTIRNLLNEHYSSMYMM